MRRDSIFYKLFSQFPDYKLTTLSREEIEAMLGLHLSESRVLREERQQGWQEGRQEGEQSLIRLLLARLVGALPNRAVAQINTLSLEQLENLGEALLDFTGLEDLLAWLEPGE